nr:P1 [Lupinus mosaic virus]
MATLVHSAVARPIGRDGKYTRKIRDEDGEYRCTLCGLGCDSMTMAKPVNHNCDGMTEDEYNADCFDEIYNNSKHSPHAVDEDEEVMEHIETPAVKEASRPTRIQTMIRFGSIDVTLFVPEKLSIVKGPAHIPYNSQTHSEMKSKAVKSVGGHLRFGTIGESYANAKAEIQHKFTQPTNIGVVSAQHMAQYPKRLTDDEVFARKARLERAVLRKQMENEEKQRQRAFNDLAQKCDSRKQKLNDGLIVRTQKGFERKPLRSKQRIEMEEKVILAITQNSSLIPAGNAQSCGRNHSVSFRTSNYRRSHKQVKSHKEIHKRLTTGKHYEHIVSKLGDILKAKPGMNFEIIGKRSVSGRILQEEENEYVKINTIHECGPRKQIDVCTNRGIDAILRIWSNKIQKKRVIPTCEMRPGFSGVVVPV